VRHETHVRPSRRCRALEAGRLMLAEGLGLPPRWPTPMAALVGILTTSDFLRIAVTASRPAGRLGEPRGGRRPRGPVSRTRTRIRLSAVKPDSPQESSISGVMFIARGNSWRPLWSGSPSSHLCLVTFSGRPWAIPFRPPRVGRPSGHSGRGREGAGEGHLRINPGRVRHRLPVRSHPAPISSLRLPKAPMPLASAGFSEAMQKNPEGGGFRSVTARGRESISGCPPVPAGRSRRSGSRSSHRRNPGRGRGASPADQWGTCGSILLTSYRVFEHRRTSQLPDGGS